MKRGGSWGGRLTEGPRGGGSLPSGPPSAARPAASRLFSGSTEVVKMTAGFSTCADVFYLPPSVVWLGSVPATTPLLSRHVSPRTAPAGTYPAAEKPGGEVRGEAGAGKEPSPRLRPWRPAAVRRGFPAGQVLRTCEGLVDQGKALGSK